MLFPTFFRVHVISAEFIASKFLITKNSTTNLELKVIANTCSPTLKSSLDRALCSTPACFCDLLNTHKAHTSISHLVIKKILRKYDLMFISNVNVTFNYIDKKLYLILCSILKILIWAMLIKENSMFFWLWHHTHLIKTNSKSCESTLTLLETEGGLQKMTHLTLEKMANCIM